MPVDELSYHYGSNECFQLFDAQPVIIPIVLLLFLYQGIPKFFFCEGEVQEYKQIASVRTESSTLTHEFFLHF